MLLEPRYNDILTAMRTRSLNHEHFERVAVALANSAGLSVRPVPGGSDHGFDGAVSQPNSEPGPFVVTTRKDVIGNLTANLKRVRAERPHASGIAALVTSQRLSERRQNNLRERARELGFVLTDIFEESAVAEFLYHHADWSMTLLQVSGEPSPLSVYPLSRRPLHDAELLHRDEQLEWLSSAGDALVAGPPGSGKTSILRHLALEGHGLFVVTEDVARIAAALRRDAPKALYVDDMDGAVSMCAELARLRLELGLCFDIVVTSWSEDAQLMQVLGLAESRVLELPQLSRDQMADVIRGAGLRAPDFLIQDVIRQAEGLPGLAVSLAMVCLHGDAREVVTGDAIAREFYAALDRLLGTHDEAGLVLAALSVGGGRGMPLGPVSQLTGLPQARVRSLLAQLMRNLMASGFVTPTRDDCVLVRPRRLRGVLIRDYLMQPPPHDVEPLLEAAPDRSVATRELILAAYAGARVDRLEEWVQLVPDPEVLGEYAALGERQSRWALATYPERATEVAEAALSYVPEHAIQALLSLGADDHRPTHSHPEHPLRLVADWVNEPPHLFSPIERKRTLVEATRRWMDGGGDARAGITAIASAFATEFRGTTVSAGSGNQILMSWGLYSADDIEQMRLMWHELVPWLESLESPRISPLVDAVHPIAFPSVPPDSPNGELSRKASHALASDMIRDVARMANDDPATLQRLNGIARRMGLGSVAQVDPVFELLFGTLSPRDDWREEQRLVKKRLAELASEWGASEPALVSERLAFYVGLASREDQMSTDRTPELCHLLSLEVSQPGLWLEPMLSHGLPSSCVYPFLERRAAADDGLPSDVVEGILSREALHPAVVMLYLKGQLADQKYASAIHELLPRYEGLVDLYAVRDEIPQSILRTLLESPVSGVRQAAAIGSWRGEEHRFPYEELREVWEAAILDSEADEHWLGEILESESELAFEWLQRHQNERETPLMFRNQFMAKATSGLSKEQRVALLAALSPSWRSEYIRRLVGDDTEMFGLLLEMAHLGRHRLDPLERRPDAVWAEFVAVASDRGWTDDEMASASLGGSRSWSGPESSMWQTELARFEAVADDRRASVKATAELCIQAIQTSIERALERERHEAVYGWGEY